MNIIDSLTKKAMENKWQDIWNKKQLSLSRQSNLDTLEQLIEVDGFNSPYGGLKKSANWIEYVERISSELKITHEDSIFEVGCGAGAFLYYFYQKGNKVAGIDYATNLVKIALEVMPKATIEVGEAINIPLENRFDVVVSNGVFLYFPSYNYAESVLQRMVKIAKKSIGIFDVPDLSKQREAINHRKAILGEAEYEKTYKDLHHLYYSKDWFRSVLANEPVQLTIEDQYIQGYGNNKYRFNVLVHKI